MTPIRMKARLPEEERDTEADTPEAARARRARHRRGAPAEPEPEPAEPDEIRDEGPPITEVARGRLADVRLHETKVRRRSSTLAGRRGSSSSGSLMRGFEAELVRSVDVSQTIRREDGGIVVIEGLASGPMDPDERAPTVSVMVDGAMYVVALDPGDTARDTAERLLTRLRRAVEVELVSADDQRAVLRFVGPTPR